MKVYNKVQMLLPGQLDLRIDDSVTQALGLRHDVLLTGFALEERKTEDNETPSNLTPRFTVVQSPFPLAAWGQLLRASLTCKPEPGSAARLQQALSDLGLICHYMETTNGLDLDRFDILSSENPERAAQLKQVDHANFIIPTTVLFFEVDPATTPPDLAGPLLELTERPTKNRATVATELQKHLDQIVDSDDFRVAWISPVETLNRLSRWKEADFLRPVEDAEELARTSQLKNLAGENVHLHRARARKKVFVTESVEGHLSVSLAPWKKYIWPKDRAIPDELSWEKESPILVVSHGDSNEKVIVWDLYGTPINPQFGTSLVDFEVLHPGGLEDPLWWNWVFSEVSEAGGNILTAVTSARIEAHWTAIRITALFPLDFEQDNGEPGDIRRLLLCFRGLQGEEGEELRSSLEVHQNFNELKQTLDETMQGQRVRLSSTLRNVRVYDPRRDSVERPYSSRFKSNPFSFIRPLDLEHYYRLYQHGERGRTRVDLAERIASQLLEGENIAVVGAHRSGKSSVLKMVQGHLDHRLVSAERTAESLVIPIPISVPLVPPQAIFPEIMSELYRWAAARKDDEGHGGEIARQILSSSQSALKDLASRFPMPNIALGIGPFKVNLTGDKSPPAPKDDKEPEAEYRKIIWSSETMTPDKALDFMRYCLRKLQSLLAKTGRTKVVVIMDEIGRLTGSEFKAVLQGWRYVIESSDFNSIRWLIAASRPITESHGLSPVTNVFMEYNVGSLREEETVRFLKVFGLPDPDNPEKLRPVLTYHAGVFLADFTSRLPYFLQVVCYHLFDRATRSVLPIIGRRACNRIIRREVMSEITDYLEYQWSLVTEEIRDQLSRMLEDAPSYPLDMGRYMDQDRFREKRFPASFRKAMLRSGLKGDDHRIIAPIAAYWLVTQAGRGQAD